MGILEEKDINNAIMDACHTEIRLVVCKRYYDIVDLIKVKDMVVLQKDLRM